MPIKNKILVAALIAVLLCCIIPPWAHVIDVPYKMHRHEPAGYSLIFVPPQARDGWSMRIDTERLFIEAVCVAALTGIALLILDKPQKRIPPPNPDN